MAHKGDERVIPKHIRDSIDKLWELNRDGYRIEVALYGFQPILRIALVNDKVAHVGLYNDGSFGEQSAQVVLTSLKKDSTYFRACSRYMKSVWDAADHVDLKTTKPPSEC